MLARSVDARLCASFIVAQHQCARTFQQGSQLTSFC
jgi:hypothetical protein